MCVGIVNYIKHELYVQGKFKTGNLLLDNRKNFMETNILSFQTKATESLIKIGHFYIIK